MVAGVATGVTLATFGEVRDGHPAESTSTKCDSRRERAHCGDTDKESADHVRPRAKHVGGEIAGIACADVFGSG